VIFFASAVLFGSFFSSFGFAATALGLPAPVFCWLNSAVLA
jgi:hypothetical protein